MLVTEAGNEIEAKLEAPENALSPILVTEFGIVIEVSDVAPRKAELAIVVTVLGTVKLFCELAAG